MEVIKIIRDADIGSDLPAPSEYRERRASRAIVFDNDGKVALLNATKKSYHKLPGGGIEEGEDIKAALGRELLEEIGCVVDNLRELGIIEEFRNGNLKLHQLSYCFLADIVGEKGIPNLEDGEAADGFETVWVDLEEAIKILESETGIERYEGKFIRLRDLIFLQEALKLKS